MTSVLYDMTTDSRRDCQKEGFALTSVHAIVGAYNEEHTIGNVLRQLVRARVSSITIVLNGCVDQSAKRAQEVSRSLSVPVYLLDVNERLGYDVPRAYGTIAAKRRMALSGSTYWLYVDGDWGGSFGPMLADYISASIVGKGDVTFVTQSALSNSDCLSLADKWSRLLRQAAPDLRDMCPFLLPVLVNDRVFQRISAAWLAHPGQWIAWLLSEYRRGYISICTYSDWSNALTGGQFRSRSHNEAMLRRLEKDYDACRAWLFGTADVHGSPERMSGLLAAQTLASQLSVEI